MSNLAELVSQFKQVKKEEEEARNRRTQLEQEIQDAMADYAELPESGQRSVTVEETGEKVMVEKKVNYRIKDKDSIRTACHEQNFEHVPFKQKVELDTKGYEWIRGNMPELFREISKYVETKPAKPRVVVKA